MPYPITRQFGPNAKGSELTFADMDNNLLYLDAKVTGSNGYVALFSGSNAVSSSVIYQNAGLIGINTTSPIVDFEVRGTSTGGKIRINNPLTTDYAELQFTTGSESKAFIFVNGSAQSGYGGANSFNLWQRSDTAPMVFHTGTTVTERMRIDANGSVGIGVSSISSSVQLTIAGDGTGKAEVGPWSSGGNYTAISLNGSGNSIADYNFLSSPTDYNLYINRPAGSSILFREGNGDRMIISSSGNVGIGTTSPNAKLAVNGNTTITGSLNVTNGITGSLLGTSSWANNSTTSSFASFASSIGSLNQDVTITGSLVNRLTTNPTRTNPHIRLDYSSSTASPQTDQAIGIIAGYTPNYDQYGPYIKFVAQGNWTGGSYPAGIDFYSQQTGGTEGLVMALSSSGNIKLNNAVYNNTATATTRTLYIGSNFIIGGLSSTRASKKNIEAISNIDWLYQLTPVTFNYRKKDNKGDYTEEIYEDLNYGLIAEDTEPIANFLINYDSKEDGNKEIVGIEYPRLIVPLLKAIQEQQNQIEELKLQVATLISGSK